MKLSKVITVLGEPTIEHSPSDAKRKWVRASMQIWTGVLAGSMQIYGDVEKPEVLEQLKKGEYTVDVEERHGQYAGEIIMAFANPVPYKPVPTQQPAQTAQKQS